jgi:hypothetical protein
MLVCSRHSLGEIPSVPEKAPNCCPNVGHFVAPNNGRNCSAGPASAGQYVAATAEVATLTSQFGSGLGPGNRTFGPGTATSAVMGQSAGVQEV